MGFFFFFFKINFLKLLLFKIILIILKFYLNFCVAFQIFLSTRWTILLNLQAEIFRVNGYPFFFFFSVLINPLLNPKDKKE
jgi:hypothetical protein